MNRADSSLEALTTRPGDLVETSEGASLASAVLTPPQQLVARVSDRRSSKIYSICARYVQKLPNFRSS